MEGHELVHLGFILSVFCGFDGSACEGWGGAGEFQLGDRHPNRSDSDFRLVRRFFHEEPVDPGHWKTQLDFSHPIWNCDRLILAVLFPSLTTWRSFAGRPGGQAECGDRHCVGRNFPPRATYLASLGWRTANLHGRRGAGLRMTPSEWRGINAEASIQGKSAMPGPASKSTIDLRLDLNGRLRHPRGRNPCLPAGFRSRKTIHLCESVWKHIHPFPQRGTAPDRPSARGPSWQ